jgi:hypothetical protein
MQDNGTMERKDHDTTIHLSGVGHRHAGDGEMRHVTERM